MASAIRGNERVLLDDWNSGVKRRRPNPPSFNKIPASTIDPAIGASTCALGSHK